MKLFKKLFGFIGFLILLCLILVAVVIFMVFDKTNNANEEIVNDTKEVNALINDDAYHALSSAKTDEKVSFMLTEDQTNYILNAVRRKIEIPFVSINAIYAIYNDDGTVDFEAPIEAYGFKSCLKGDLDIDLTSDGIFYIYLNSVSVGKISSTNFLFKFIISKALNLDTINQSLNDSGIYLNITNNEGTYVISMTKEQMKATLTSLLKDDPTNDLFNAIVETVIGDDLFKLYFNEEDSIGAVLNLKDLAYSGTLTYDLYSGANNINTLKESLKTLFVNGKVNYENLSTSFDYLVRGYDALSDENKEVIDKIDFTSIGITSNKTYSGIVNKSSLTMAKIFLDAMSFDFSNIANVLLKGYYDISISESNLNELFNSLSFIGTSFAFASFDGDISNITITSLYAELLDEKLEMYLALDVDGKYINAKVNASTKESKGAVITLSVDSLCLGTKEVNESAKASLLKYLESVLTGLDFLQVDAENQTMALDFSSYVKDSFFEKLASYGLDNIGITMSSKNNGELILRISNPLK